MNLTVHYEKNGMGASAWKNEQSTEDILLCHKTLKQRNVDYSEAKQKADNVVQNT